MVTWSHRLCISVTLFHENGTEYQGLAVILHIRDFYYGEFLLLFKKAPLPLLPALRLFRVFRWMKHEY